MGTSTIGGSMTVKRRKKSRSGNKVIKRRSASLKQAKVKSNSKAAKASKARKAAAPRVTRPAGTPKIQARPKRTRGSPATTLKAVTPAAPVQAFAAAAPALRPLTFSVAAESTAHIVRVTLTDESNRTVIDTSVGRTSGQSSPRTKGSPVFIGVEVKGTHPQKGAVNVGNGAPSSVTLPVPAGLVGDETTAVIEADW